MNRYETLFIIKPDQNEEQIQSVITRLTDRVAEIKGKVAAIDHWGIRRMAYTVQYRGERLNKGYYVLFTYLGDGKTVDEVERNIKILDPAFRFISVKLADKVDPDAVTEVAVTKRSEPPAPPPFDPTRQAAPAPESGPEPEAAPPPEPAGDGGDGGDERDEEEKE